MRKIKSIAHFNQKSITKRSKKPMTSVRKVEENLSWMIQFLEGKLKPTSKPELRSKLLQKSWQMVVVDKTSLTMELARI